MRKWLRSVRVSSCSLACRRLDASSTCCVLNCIRSRRERSCKLSMGNTPSRRMTPSTLCITTSYVRASVYAAHSYITLSSSSSHFLPLCCFSGSMLKVNPEERLSITELVNQLQEVAAARNVNPKSPITEVSVCTASPAFSFVGREKQLMERNIP